MAIVFPRDMPTSAPVGETFEPQRVDYLSPEAGGRLGAISAGYPLWVGEWVLPSQGQAEADEWRAFVTSLRGPGRLFYGRDRWRPLPLAYLKTGMAGMVRAVGGGAFDGTATSWSVNGTRDVLTLQGLPAGFVFSLNDYVGFRWTTSGQHRRSLVRAVEAAVANGSGQLVVSVEPPLPLLTSVAAVANLDRPDCLMKLSPGESQIGAKARGQKMSGQIKAVQQLLS